MVSGHPGAAVLLVALAVVTVPGVIHANARRLQTGHGLTSSGLFLSGSEAKRQPRTYHMPCAGMMAAATASRVSTMPQPTKKVDSAWFTQGVAARTLLDKKYKLSPDVDNKDCFFYRASGGENLESIAKDLGVTKEALIVLNSNHIKDPNNVAGKLVQICGVRNTANVDIGGSPVTAPASAPTPAPAPASAPTPGPKLAAAAPPEKEPEKKEETKAPARAPARAPAPAPEPEPAPAPTPAPKPAPAQPVQVGFPGVVRTGSIGLPFMIGHRR